MTISMVLFSKLGMSFIAGCGLGLFYFGGLWLTVRQLPKKQHPLLWMFASFILRLSILLLLFYGIIRHQAGLEEVLSIVFCFLGFIAMRTFLIQKLGISLPQSPLKS